MNDSFFTTPAPTAAEDLNSTTLETINMTMKVSIAMVTGPNSGAVDFTEFLWKFIPPFVILFGTVGNVLSFAVMSRKKLSDTPMSLCLRLLAIVDTTVLWTGYLRYWIWKTFEYDIRRQHDVTCKGHALLVHWSTQYASWILICIAMDRVSVVYMPVCARRACTKFRMGICLFCIGVILILINAHFICTVHIDKNGICNINAENNMTESFLGDFWPWIDLGIYSIVPFILISICNIGIIINLCQKRKNSGIKSTTTHYFLTRSRINTMAYTLFIISCSFILTTLPIAIFMIIYMYSIDKLTTKEELCFAVVNFLCYMNSASNFILYCISSSYFRRELNVMFTCGRKGALTFNASNSGRPRLSLQNINEGSSCVRHEQAYEQMVPGDGTNRDL